MSMSDSKARLVALTRELSRQWDLTTESWQDAKAREFEQHYLAELWAGVDNAATVIDQLERLVRNIRRDCE